MPGRGAAESYVTRDRTQTVQEVHELRYVVNVDRMLAEQRMLEADRHASVGIFNVEDDGVAAHFTPVLDHADAVIAAGHESREIDGADFEIFRDRDRLFGDRSRDDAGDDDLLVVLENVRAVGLVIDGADRFG